MKNEITEDFALMVENVLSYQYSYMYDRTLSDFIEKFLKNKFTIDKEKYTKSEELFIKFLVDEGLYDYLNDVIKRLYNIDTAKLYDIKNRYEKTTNELEVLKVLLSIKSSKLFTSMVVFYCMIVFDLVFEIDEEDIEESIGFKLSMSEYLFFLYLKFLKVYLENRIEILDINFDEFVKGYRQLLYDYFSNDISVYDEDELTRVDFIRNQLTNVISFIAGKINNNRVSISYRINKDVLFKIYSYYFRYVMKKDVFYNLFKEFMLYIVVFLSEKTKYLIDILYEKMIVISKYNVDLKELEKANKEIKGVKI